MISRDLKLPHQFNSSSRNVLDGLTVTVLGFTNSRHASSIISQVNIESWIGIGKPRMTHAVGLAAADVVLEGVVEGAAGVVEIFGVVEGAAGVVETFGVVEGAAGVVEGAAGVVEGALGVVDGAAGVVDGSLGVVDGAAGVVESCLFFLKGNVQGAVTVTDVVAAVPVCVAVTVL